MDKDDNQVISSTVLSKCWTTIMICTVQTIFIEAFSWINNVCHVAVSETQEGAYWHKIVQRMQNNLAFDDLKMLSQEMEQCISNELE